MGIVTPVTATAQTPFGPATALRRAVAAVNAGFAPGRSATDVELARGLAAVLRAHGEPDDLAGIAAEVEGLRAVLDALYAVFAAGHDDDRAAERLNRLLERHGGPLRLVREPGTAWHLHADRPESGWADWLAASSALALAVHLAEHGAAWGICEAPRCRHVYVQDGPGRPRRTCSPQCATRRRVAAHRARRS
jgi:predicted RNA-binding Zn ribbon-like protein